MKKVNSRLFCMVIALIMIFSSSVFAYDSSNDLTINPSAVSENSIVKLTGDVEITASGTCYLGHWFTEKEYYVDWVSCKSRGGYSCYYSICSQDVCTNCGWRGVKK